MKLCTKCQVEQPETGFYPSKTAKDGLRIPCKACLTNGRPPGPQPIPFFSRYKEDENGCWVWQGARHPQGYGSVKYQGKTVMAHRVSYILTHGDIPADVVIDHLCSNKPCINPAHLEAVAHEVNLQRARDRSHCGSCSCRPFAKRRGLGARKPMKPEHHLEWLFSNHKVDERGCHIWQGRLIPSGYGGIKWEGRSTVAHRVIFEVLHGKQPRDIVIDHVCSNRACVNPEHLEAVSQSENTQRAWDKRHCATCTCDKAGTK